MVNLIQLKENNMNNHTINEMLFDEVEKEKINLWLKISSCRFDC